MTSRDRRLRQFRLLPADTTKSSIRCSGKPSNVRFRWKTTTRFLVALSSSYWMILDQYRWPGIQATKRPSQPTNRSKAIIEIAFSGVIPDQNLIL